MTDFEIFMNDEPVKVCLRCRDELPACEFGISRDRADGLNIYCRRCVREKMALSRAALKEMFPVPRKEPYDGPREPKARIKWAIRKGASDRERLQKLTKIPFDLLMDYVAEMAFDDHQIKVTGGRIRLA